MTKFFSAGLVHLHLGVVLMGLTGLFGKLIAQSPITITSLRGLSCFLLLFFVLAKKKRLSKIKLRLVLSVIPPSLVYGAHFITFFHSVQVSGVGLGTIAFTTFPFFVIFLEPLIFGGKINPRNILLTLLMICGVYLIVPSFSLEDKMFVGIAWGILSGFLFALNLLIIRKSLKSSDPITVTFLQTFFYGILLLPFSELSPGNYSWNDILYLSLLGFLCTGVGITLINSSMRTVMVQTVAITIGLEAFYAVIFAYLWIGETMTPLAMLGGVLIVITGALVTYLESKSKKIVIL